MLDFDRLADALVTGAKRYVDKALSPLLARMAAVEARATERGEKGEPGRDGADGKSVTAEDIASLIFAEVARAMAALPKPQDGAAGKDADPAEVGRLIDEKMAAAVAAVPAPKDGRDGADGASVDPSDVQAMVAMAVKEAVAAIHVPEDGADGANGKDGSDGRDGVGLAGALLDRSGSLILTLTDGSTRDLGPVIGKDGAPGKDGRDGFGLTDFEAEKKDPRTAILSFTSGEIKQSYELDLPAVVYRGVYREGENYSPGDMATWGGSLWHCDVETDDKPDGQQKHWTLAVKRGRDGKDGGPAAEKAAGPVNLGGGKH